MVLDRPLGWEARRGDEAKGRVAPTRPRQRSPGVMYQAGVGGSCSWSLALAYVLVRLERCALAWNRARTCAWPCSPCSSTRPATLLRRRSRRSHGATVVHRRPGLGSTATFAARRGRPGASSSFAEPSRRAGQAVADARPGEGLDDDAVAAELIASRSSAIAKDLLRARRPGVRAAWGNSAGCWICTTRRKLRRPSRRPARAHAMASKRRQPNGLDEEEQTLKVA